MTLQQWTERYGIKPTHSTTEIGAVSIIMPDIACQSCVELYYLQDYVVSSRSGLVLWLIPRKDRVQCSRGETMCNDEIFDRATGVD